MQHICVKIAQDRGGLKVTADKNCCTPLFKCEVFLTQKKSSTFINYFQLVSTLSEKKRKCLKLEKPSVPHLWGSTLMQPGYKNNIFF